MPVASVPASVRTAMMPQTFRHPGGRALGTLPVVVCATFAASGPPLNASPASAVATAPQIMPVEQQDGAHPPVSTRRAAYVKDAGLYLRPQDVAIVPAELRHQLTCGADSTPRAPEKAMPRTG